MTAGSGATPTPAGAAGGGAVARDRFAAAAVFTILVLLSALLLSIKPVWYDEFFTLVYSRAASWPQYGEMLKHGGDTNPPLLHLAPRATQALLGDNVWGLRLPFLLAYAATSLLAFRLVARRCGPAYGLLALAMVWVKFRYAYEARSPALVLFGFALAASGWLDRAEDRHPRAGLACLLAGGLIATLSHFYGVLSLAPIGLAEMARTWTRRRIDVAVWGALLVCALPLAALLPVARSIQGRVGPDHPAAVRPRDLLHGYAWYVGGLHRAVAAGLVLAVCAVFARRRTAAPDSPQPSVAVHEWILWSGAAALPAAGFILAVGATGVFFARHFIAALMGIAMLAGLGACRLFRGRAAFARIPAGALCALVVVQQILEIPVHLERRHDLAALESELQTLDASTPVVTIDYPRYPQYAHYLRPDLAARIVCVLHDAHAWHPDFDLLGLRRFAPLRVILSDELNDWPEGDVYLIESRGFAAKASLFEPRADPAPARP